MYRFLSISLLLIALINNVYTQKIVLEQSLRVPKKEINAVMLEITFAPGDQGLPPHTHPGPVVGYVIDGEFLFQYQGGPLEIISAGQAFYEENGAVHVWGANASNDTSCKVVVTLMGRPGEPIFTIVDNVERDDFNTAIESATKRI